MESTTLQYNKDLDLTWKSGHSTFEYSEHTLIWNHTVYRCIQEIRAHSVNSEWLYIHTTVNKNKKRTTSHILNMKNPSWILRSKIKIILLKVSLYISQILCSVIKFSNLDYIVVSAIYRVLILTDRDSSSSMRGIRKLLLMTPINPLTN